MLMFVIYALAVFFYILTIVVAHKIMKDGLGWTEGADSPLPMVWPLVILVWVILLFPVMFCVWLVHGMPKALKKKARKAKPQEVK